MKMRIRSPNDLFVGAFLIAVAVIALWLTSNLRLGAATRMGPGYMPVALCWILLMLGAAIGVRGFVTQGEPTERWAPRPLLFICAGIACFALTIERFGLVVAVVAAVLVGSLADPLSRRLETGLLAAGLAAFCSAIFVKALGLPMQIWPELR